MPILSIIAIVFSVRSLMKKKEQLNRMEEKLDKALGKTPKN